MSSESVKRSNGDGLKKLKIICEKVLTLYIYRMYNECIVNNVEEENTMKIKHAIFGELEVEIWRLESQPFAFKVHGENWDSCGYPDKMEDAYVFRFASQKKLKGKNHAGLKISKAEYDEMKQIMEIFKAEIEAYEMEERRAIQAGEIKITCTYHDGEYYSGHTTGKQATKLLEGLGLAKYLSGWGTPVDYKLIETLGTEFTYAQAVEYARPEMEAKAAKKIENDKRDAEKAERRNELKCEILSRVKGGHGEDDDDPSALVRLTDPDTNESLEFNCRNIFDFGYTVNPNYSILPGMEKGGLDSEGKWQTFESGKGWYDVRDLTDFEKKCMKYLYEFSPISTEMRM